MKSDYEIKLEANRIIGESPKHLVCYCGYLLRDHPNRNQVIECYRKRTDPKNCLNQVIEVITKVNPAKINTKIILDEMLESWDIINKRVKMFYKLRGF